MPGSAGAPSLPGTLAQLPCRCRSTQLRPAHLILPTNSGLVPRSRPPSSVSVALLSPVEQQLRHQALGCIFPFLPNQEPFRPMPARTTSLAARSQRQTALLFWPRQLTYLSLTPTLDSRSRSSAAPSSPLPCASDPHRSS